MWIEDNDSFDLDRLMPMHISLSAEGIIQHVGPTLAKTRPPQALLGRSVFDVFEFRRPAGIDNIEDLRDRQVEPLRLCFRDPPQTALRGLMAGGAPDRSLLLNLSFGISIQEAIRQYNLHSTDFADTDTTLEVLYLIEAGAAAMEESRALNDRLQRARMVAEEKAYTDTLTGLKNRRALSTVLTRYRMNGTPYTIMGIDLDYFKSINDTFGHAAGDHVLREVARIMVSMTRPDDTLVRTGGDEFVIILKDLVVPADAARLGQKIIAALEMPMMFEGHECSISGSIGLFSTIQDPACDTSGQLARVDDALYTAKRQGRGQVVVYAPTSDHALTLSEPRETVRGASMGSS